MIIYYDKVFSLVDEDYKFEKAKVLKPSIKMAREHFHDLVIEPSLLAATNDLLLVHEEDYIRQIYSLSKHPEGKLDDETFVNRYTILMALLAVGCVKTAVMDTKNKKTRASFCMIRPPGHHAGFATGGGHCIFNNVAFGVRTAQKNGYKKVLIIDWDVHHGNGTQEIFNNDNTVFYFSVHRQGVYPGSGWHEDNGAGKGIGYTLNIPLPANTTRESYIEHFRSGLASAIKKQKPDIIFISCGFDAEKGDPDGDLGLLPEDFGTMTSIITKLGVPIVSCLEGGYNPVKLAECMKNHLFALSGYG